MTGLLEELRRAGLAPNLQELITSRLESAEIALRRIQSARIRLARRRHWLYQNLAVWITATYDIVAWQQELSIKKLAQRPGKAVAVRRAGGYRHIAAIGSFRRMLGYQAEKRRSLLIDGASPYSSITCFSCGTRTAGGGQLNLQCPSGHLFDQDENAARWFLSKIDEKTVTEGHLREKATSAIAQSIEVPTVLKDVVVPQSPSGIPPRIESGAITAA